QLADELAALTVCGGLVIAGLERMPGVARSSADLIGGLARIGDGRLGKIAGRLRHVERRIPGLLAILSVGGELVAIFGKMPDACHRAFHAVPRTFADTFSEPTHSVEQPHHRSPSAGRSMKNNQSKVAIVSV